MVKKVSLTRVSGALRNKPAKTIKDYFQLKEKLCLPIIIKSEVKHERELTILDEEGITVIHKDESNESSYDSHQTIDSTVKAEALRTNIDKRFLPSVRLYDCMKTISSKVTTNETSKRSNKRMKPTKKRDVSKSSKKQSIPEEFLRFRDVKYKVDFGPPFKCDICSKTVDTKVLIRRHVMEHYVKNLGVCKICTLSFANVREHMKVHLKKKKYQQKFKCEPCSLTFDTKQEHTTHVQHHRPYVCTVCSKAFNVKQTLRRHFAAIHVQENKFKCNLCPEKSFSTNYRLKCHYIVNHTTDKPFKCSQCPKSYSLKYKLKKHQFRHVDYNSLPFKCEICPKKFPYRYFLKNHVLQNHSMRRDFVCDVCSKGFSAKDLLAMHMKVHIRSYMCHRCPTTFPSEAFLKFHLETHAETADFKCDICSKSFLTKIHIKNHMMYHACRAFKCDKCEKVCISYPSLKRHIFLHHTENVLECEKCHENCKTEANFKKHKELFCRLFKCDFCSYSSYKKSVTEKHMKTHNAEKLFYCNECGKFLSSKKTLIDHAKVHDAGAFKCSECPQTFRKETYLLQHAWHHKGKEFSCDQCPLLFVTTTALKYHVARRHMKKKMHTCELCGMGYSLKVDLTAHLRKHLNRLELNCDICSMTFDSNWGLQKHRQTHDPNRERSFKCSQCNKSFLSKRSHDQHQRIHTGYAPWKCGKCGKSFTRQDYLKNHDSRVHLLQTHFDKKSKIRYTCDICKKKFNSHSAISCHIYMVHVRYSDKKRKNFTTAKVRIENTDSTRILRNQKRDKNTFYTRVCSVRLKKLDMTTIQESQLCI